MNRRTILAGMALAGTLPVAGQALAQTGQATQAASGKALDPAKMKALMGGDFATASSELARQKGTANAVKVFAQLEIREQAAVAKAFGAEPGSAGLSEKHRQMLAKLEAASGAEFDRMYIDGQMEGHQELLAIHKQYAENGEDPMARGASMVGVPSIETHLGMLKTIRQSLG
ncbi:DUF4142 domain-containing protein [Rhizobium sp. CSW-27]|uniref:DUF4142 domain-containing protein n=1 Tax=Rhizobium sp. CSW-27 TaxID=2839985 RepID=UPI001C00F65B|nr:DUF4142 domain-containing protein [Rhizobium sp. CSW-27]MBT9368673.1 DUF4142 domain-containing protein [Rhizobium sp. CSW-27]